MIVIVVGMHRSGTSAVAGLLHANGICMGDDSCFFPPPMKENPKGFYENKKFRTINDQILKYNDYKVKSFNPETPPYNCALSSETWDRMVCLIEDYESKEAVWGWKDPRTALTLFRWLLAIHHVVGTLTEVRLLILYRDYEEIAKSMRRRGNKETSESQFVSLAGSYYETLSKTLSCYRVPFLSLDFNTFLTNTKSETRFIAQYLGYPLPNTEFVDPKISRSGGIS